MWDNFGCGLWLEWRLGVWAWRILGLDGIWGFIFMSATKSAISATVWVRTATKFKNRITKEFRLEI
ncbi:hypothetical protein D9754_14415 [Planomicrobium sp. Y74]|nr:hypothetical protein D9754_14415 [Planomicrobium sp. Y74]